MILNPEVMDDLVYTVVNTLLTQTYNVGEEVAGDLAHAAAFAARCRAEEITKDYRKQGDE